MLDIAGIVAFSIKLRWIRLKLCISYYAYKRFPIKKNYYVLRKTPQYATTDFYIVFVTAVHKWPSRAIILILTDNISIPLVRKISFFPKLQYFSLYIMNENACLQVHFSPVEAFLCSRIKLHSVHQNNSIAKELIFLNEQHTNLSVLLKNAFSQASRRGTKKLQSPMIRNCPLLIKITFI